MSICVDLSPPLAVKYETAEGQTSTEDGGRRPPASYYRWQS